MSEANRVQRVIDGVEERRELWTVKAEDFFAVGPLHPTSEGIARCRMEPFADLILHATEGLPRGRKTLNRSARKAVQDAIGRAFLITTILICSDETGKVETNDEDLERFIEANRAPLARLIEPAFISCLPGVMDSLGIL